MAEQRTSSAQCTPGLHGYDCFEDRQNAANECTFDHRLSLHTGLGKTSSESTVWTLCLLNNFLLIFSCNSPEQQVSGPNTAPSASLGSRSFVLEFELFLSS